MKKTLAAAAVLGAFAGSALAANVTLYGVVDLGLNTPTPIRTRLPALPTSCRWLPVLKQVPVSA